MGRRLRLGKQNMSRRSRVIAMATAQPDCFGCGQGFNCVVPQTGERVWRSAFGTHAAMGFGNAILLTGDVEKYASTWRGVLDAVNANSKEENGQTLYPHVYGAFTGSGDEPKWDQYTAVPYNQGADELFFWTQNPADLTWAGESRWRDFLAGGDAGYPVDRLSDTLERLRDLVDEMRHREFTNPTTRLSDVTPLQSRPRFDARGLLSQHSAPGCLDLTAWGLCCAGYEPHQPRPLHRGAGGAHVRRHPRRPHRLPAPLPAALLRPRAPPRGPPVSRTIIAGIWVAVFRECQR